MKAINIAMAADWQYAMPLETTIKSIAYNNKNFNIYILNPDIPQEWFRSLNNFLKKINGHLVDCKYIAENLKGQTISQQHVNITSSARLLISKLIPVSRVLYLDADLIVCQSLAELFEMDMQGKTVAAVEDWGQPSDFNAGVMLLNLDQMREDDDITNKMLAFGAQPGLDNGDQTVFNYFFAKTNCLKLDHRYNMQMGQEQKIYNWITQGNSDAQVLLDNIREYMKSEKEEVIVHYLGAAKPWDITSIGHQRNLWWQVHDLDWKQVLHHEPLPIKIPKKRPGVLIYTLTDNLLHLPQLVNDLSMIDFNIITPGLFNNHFNVLMKHSNVHLYPAAMPAKIDELISQCHIILDIAPVPDEYRGINILKKGLDQGNQIFSFNSIRSNELCTEANYQTFDDNQLTEIETKLFMELCLK